MIDAGKTGILVPANDPWQAAFEIIQLYENHPLLFELGNNARKIALNRHTPKNILQTLRYIYLQVISEKKEY